MAFSPVVGNLVTRGLGGRLLPTAGLGPLFAVVTVEEIADIGADGGDDILLRTPNQNMIAILAATLLIIDDDLE